MHAGEFSRSADDEVMSEMNMIPLVDIMLVLLIIFIITAPVMHHAFNLELPQESSQPQELEPDSIQIAVQVDGTYRWNSDVVTQDELKVRLGEVGAQEPQPALHISADKNTRYEEVINVLGIAQGASLTKIGFVTDPS